ncbi:hypothetical protein MTP03_08520 [Tsukamurella sp. PLM1]|nr:hypothetical protein MTP03_08520 [Tsukamurella sp. PLM1]
MRFYGWSRRVMTQSREELRAGRRQGATQVLDNESITAIIPLDELEARLEAAYAETWADAPEGESALVYRPSSPRSRRTS